MACVTHRSSQSIRTLLVPLDGSTQAEQAIPVAANLAKRAGATLHFATVEPPPGLLAADLESADSYLLALRQVRNRLRTYLNSRAEAVRTTHGVRTSVSVLQGQAPEALASYAANHHIDLIVMTTHGRGGISRFWLGSVADQLLRRTTVPVLLLRPGRTSRPTQFHRVLIALDGSPQSEGAIGPGLTLAGTTPGSRVVLAHVFEPTFSLIEPEEQEEELSAATARLERLAHGLELQGFPLSWRVVSGQGVANQIRKLADAEEADWLVVGTHGARGVHRLLLGSVADKVVRSASQPVLVVPCKPKPAERSRAPAVGAGVTAESAVP
jgi:nucleotide-binding universal stress UspA family protein